MPVFRVEKNSNYTTMCNYHLRDQGLSLKGKGLLSMLLSLPDTWNYSVRGLSSITPDGVDGVLTALKELERLGYLERNQVSFSPERSSAVQRWHQSTGWDVWRCLAGDCSHGASVILGGTGSAVWYLAE